LYAGAEHISQAGLMKIAIDQQRALTLSECDSEIRRNNAFTFTFDTARN
jgi:hypothetical protein